MDHKRRSVRFDRTLNMIWSLSRGRFRLSPSTMYVHNVRPQWTVHIRINSILRHFRVRIELWYNGSYCIAKKVDSQWIFEHALRYVHWQFGKKCPKFQPITQNRMTWWTMVNHEDLCQPHLTNHIMNWKWPYYTQILTALLIKYP